MSLKSGTKPTGRGKSGSLTVSEICQIIETSHRCGVAKIECGGLSVDFRVPVEQASSTLVDTPTEEATLVKHDEQNQKTLELDEAKLKEDKLALMLIENPLEAEKLLAWEELDEEVEDEDE